jgi:hypothetical protein
MDSNPESCTANINVSRLKKCPELIFDMGRSTIKFGRRKKEITATHIKTPNPKCRLYWRLIEFIDWRYSQSCWYFQPAL